MNMPEPVRNLAERVRAELVGMDLVEKRMFGGITFMLNGNMLCCATKQGLMVRVGKEAEAAALQLPYARPCDGTGHKMPGFVMIAVEGLRSDRGVAAGLEPALRYVSALPPKDQLPKRTARESGAF